MSTVEITSERVRRLVETARESAALASDDREARDKAIGEAEQAGWSVNRIARETGLSVGHVHRILMKRTAARQTEAA